MKKKEQISEFRVSDLYLLTMSSIMIIINLLFFELISQTIINVLTLLLVILFAIFIIKYYSYLEKTDFHRSTVHKRWKDVIFIFRNAYYALGTVTIYSQFQVLIKAFRTYEYDLMLNQWDIAILGTRAGDLMNSIVNPYLTEYLQIAYSSFYFIPLIVGAEILLRKRDKFEVFARNIIFTFYFSYFLYIFLPAIGPRFSVYNFNSINLELPGIYITNFLREIINFGGGIVDKTIDPAAIVNRDCMPSGHTMVTLVSIFFAFKNNVKSRYIILTIGLSIIIATIYLRYHYLVDIIAGIIFAVISIMLEPYIAKIFKLIFKRKHII